MVVLVKIIDSLACSDRCLNSAIKMSAKLNIDLCSSMLLLRNDIILPFIVMFSVLLQRVTSSSFMGRGSFLVKPEVTYSRGFISPGAH
jgi:hypothetical protein